MQPKIVVVMGRRGSAALNGLQVPLSRPIEPRMGEIQASPQRSTPSTSRTSTSPSTNRTPSALLGAFRMLGTWYAAQPPY